MENRFRRHSRWHWFLLFFMALTIAVVGMSMGSSVALAADEPAAATAEQESAYTFNTIVMFVCAVLVLFMQAGFAMLEVGLNPA